MTKSNKLLYRWTDEEMNVLKKMWFNVKFNMEDISLVIPGRTLDAIKTKAKTEKWPTFHELRRPQIDLERYKELCKVYDVVE